MTHKYVGFTNNTEMELLDIWHSSNESFIWNNNLYKDKLRNQMGRILRMATFQYAPYTIIDSNDTSESSLKGSEMSSMITFVKYLNVTPEFVVNPEDYWGVINEDWTGNGLLGNLIYDNADIGFAALYTWEVEYRYLDLSKPLIRTGVTCLTPAPTLAAGWLTPVYSYSYAMWCFVASTFIVSILVHSFMFLVKHKMEYDRKDTTKATPIYNDSIFVIFKLFMVQLINSSEFPPGKNGTLFMGIMFLFSFFLTSTYSSGLSTIMTIPRYDNAINTVDEFVKSGISWVGTHSGWVDSIEQAEDEHYKIIVKKFEPFPVEDEIRELSKTPFYAFALERLPQGNYAIGTYIEDDVIENFRLMKEDFYWEQVVIMTRKSSVLLPLLDQFILKIVEAGLVPYWQNEAVMLHMNTYVQKVVRYFTTNKERFIVKLKWNHVSGAFNILIFGCLISTIIFVCEICSNRLHKNPK